MAACATVYRFEVDRKTHLAGKKLYSVLWSATDPERIQWYFNGIRARHTINKRYRSLLASGTSSVESLNHEINSWFDNMPEIYTQTPVSYTHLTLPTIYSV